MMTGMNEVEKSFLIFSHASKPFISSMLTSMRIKSGSSVRALSTASLPLDAVETSYPHDSRRNCVRLRMSGSSSTARIFCDNAMSFL
jgi:hypothetical protein